MPDRLEAGIKYKTLGHVKKTPRKLQMKAIKITFGMWEFADLVIRKYNSV